MTRKVKRGAKIWIRVFPDKPITKKPLEVRQGKGKGNVEYWVCPIKPGKILYEMEGVDEDIHLASQLLHGRHLLLLLLLERAHLPLRLLPLPPAQPR